MEMHILFPAINEMWNCIVSDMNFPDTCHNVSYITTQPRQTRHCVASKILFSFSNSHLGEVVAEIREGEMLLSWSEVYRDCPLNYHLYNQH